MTSAVAKYSYINAKLRARISKILPDETFEKLVKAPSLDSALNILRDTDFAELQEIYSTTGDLKKAELELLKKEIHLYTELKRFVHVDLVQFINALLYQFEIENLKNAIRIFFDRKIRNHPADPNIHYIIYEPIIHQIPLDVIINASSFDEVSDVCIGTPFEKIIKKFNETVISEGSLFRMEVAFDHFYYNNLLQSAKKLDDQDREIVSRLTGVEIDLKNIDWLIRMRNFYDMPQEAVLSILIQGGYSLNTAVISDLYRAQNVSVVLQDFVKGKYPGLTSLISTQAGDSHSRLMLIHRILEEIMKQEVRRIRSGFPFTIGIILAYFILKKNELKKIRTILNAKQYNLSQQRIESML